jgi:imidazolonepropionase-like amidohydrolase
MTPMPSMLHLALRSRARSAALLACAAFCVLPSAAEAQNGKLAIKVGKILPKPGAPPIEEGVIVIVDGRISAIGGKDTDIPWDAEVIDAPQGVAFPGFVESQTSNGIDRPNENIDVVPFLKISDSVDPVAFYFEDALRWGITTINVQQGNQTVIGGQGLIVRPTGMTVDEMQVSTDAGVKLSATPKRGNSSATQLQALRQAFDDLRHHLEDLVQQKKEGKDLAHREALFQGRDLEGEGAKGRVMQSSAWKVEGLENVPRGEVDEKQAPLLALVEGQMRAFFYCGRAMDVGHALAVARENGFLTKTVLLLDGDAWKAADRIAEAGVPVILEGDVQYSERDVVTGELRETFVPGELDRRGVRFALSGESPSGQPLAFQAARCVGLGLARDKAIAAVTTVPAEVLGLGNRVGSLEVGKDGNVLVLSGDPLSVTTFVDRVVIEGKPVYDRTKDIRIQHLLEGKTPPGTMAMDAPPDGGPVCCEETLPHTHDPAELLPGAHPATPPDEKAKPEDKGKGDEKAKGDEKGKGEDKKGEDKKNEKKSAGGDPK